MSSLNNPQRDALSPEMLQLFVAGLSGLSPEEVRKAKSLYIRNAIAEYEALQGSLSGFRVAQGCFMMVPIFWPIIYGQNRMFKSQQTLARQRIKNAIDVWRDDLAGESFEINGEAL